MQTTHVCYLPILFSQDTGFDISCNLSPMGDNSHEISKPVLRENKIKIFFICHLLKILIIIIVIIIIIIIIIMSIII